MLRLGTNKHEGDEVNLTVKMRGHLTRMFPMRKNGLLSKR